MQTIKVDNIKDAMVFKKVFMERAQNAKWIKTTLQNDNKQLFEFDSGDPLLIIAGTVLKGKEADQIEQAFEELQKDFANYQNDDGLDSQILFRLSKEEKAKLQKVKEAELTTKDDFEEDEDESDE